MSNAEGRSFRILIFILVISTLNQSGLSKLLDNSVYHVHLLNRMSSSAEPVMIHVRSKDNDLGEHALLRNGHDFQFHFKLNFFSGTVFYCDFKHGNKSKRFTIFWQGEEGKPNSEAAACAKPLHTVYWKVKDDGFYRSCDDKTYVKMHDWYNS
ncbi:hypothetical protein PTKIN_Ptkin09bG0212800 [Pterospermum kingtungense]